MAEQAANNVKGYLRGCSVYWHLLKDSALVQIYDNCHQGTCLEGVRKDHVSFG